MNNFNILRELINQANEIVSTNDFGDNINKLSMENIQLKDTIFYMEKQISELNFKYNKDTEILSNELKTTNDELSNLTKVSTIKQIYKQLEEKNNYCQILESQLEKLKREQQILNKSVKNNKIDEDLVIDSLVCTIDNIIKNDLTNNNKFYNSDLINEFIIKNKEGVYNTIEILLSKHKQNNSLEQLIDNPDMDYIRTFLYQNIKLVDFDNNNKIVEDNNDNNNNKIVEDNNDNNNNKIVEDNNDNNNNKIVEDNENNNNKIVEDNNDNNNIVVNDNNVTVRKKSKKNKEIPAFDIENFEDINGYDLITYKSNYYLKNLETNEIFDIKLNKPDKVVGLINSKGKVKLG